MNKSQAIRKKCLECSGGSPKEVTLCLIVDCPLWPFRFGYSIRDKRYEKRMKAAKKNYPEEYQEMVKLLSKHIKNMPNSHKNAQMNNILEKKAA